MMKYSKGKPLTRQEAAWYSKQHKSLKATTETVIKMYDDEYTGRTFETTFVVFTGSYTPYLGIRDCGDHYIEALTDRYRYISKDFQTIIEDVEDK